jgi:flavin-dependent dehydrogenase
MRADADVVIAGAGPAGSLTALLLARAGVRVRLFDRSAFPRDKLCGDTLNPGALAILRRLDVLGDLPARALPVRGMVVTGEGGVRVAAEYGHGVGGLSVRRRDLDWLLLQAAIGAGAIFEPQATVLGAAVDGRDGHARVRGVRLQGASGAERILSAPLTIAADGRHSRLGFSLGLSRHPVRPRRWAIGAYFEGLDDLDGFGEMHIRSRTYIGVAAVPGPLTNACVVVSDPRPGTLADPARLLLDTIRRDFVLADRFVRARLTAPPTVLGPLAVDSAGAGMPGLLLVGDAAGFVDPMTGDGLRFAFRGAELASDVALRALSGRCRDAAGELGRRRAEAFNGKWRLNRALRTVVASPRAISWAGRAARICPALLREVIRRAGDLTEMRNEK